ncbi:MAG: Gfo/Idh/MocA family oxidoreductase [Planctomycetota bacterium]|nr:Gfo/Idh/MocA family oxidoreductase [Planctomycetota bacterium]
MSFPNRRQAFQYGTSAATVAALSTWHVQAPAGHATGEKIKAGQIGTKHAHAGGKMSTLRKFSDEFEVLGVVEPDDARWAAVKSQPAYRDVPRMTEEQMLNAPGLELVAVETTVRNLVPTAARCVAAGKHIHLDKPAGENLSDFKKVLDDATRQRLTVQMGYMFRYNPAFAFLFDALRKGWLGEPFEAHGVISKKVNPATRRNLAEYPGGTMFELGCHLIDALTVAMGPPDKVTPFTRRTRPDLDQLADNQLAVFEYARATATIRSAVVEVAGGSRRQFVLCGSEGTVDIKPLEPPKLLLTLEQKRGQYRRGTQMEIPLKPLGGRYDGDFRDLAKVLRGAKQSDYPPAHDLAVQAAVLRASGVPVN